MVELENLVVPKRLDNVIQNLSCYARVHHAHANLEITIEAKQHLMNSRAEAERIVSRFGEHALDVIDRDAERLLEEKHGEVVAGGGAVYQEMLWALRRMMPGSGFLRRAPGQEIDRFPGRLPEL
jgi:hypothetical protein